MLVEPHHPVIVKEPAAPSLPLDIGGGSGSANDVNLVEFQKWSKVEIEMALKSKDLDWKAIAESNKALAEGTSSYVKVLLCDLPGDRDLFLMLWPPLASTTIHGHPGDGCVHKLLEGKLTETLYSRSGEKGQPTTIYPSGNSTFINDDIGYHVIKNPDAENWAYSIHLYPKCALDPKAEFVV